MTEVSAELWDALLAVAEAATATIAVVDFQNLEREDPDGLAALAALTLELAAYGELETVDEGERTRRAAYRARGLLIETSERHEREVHDGETCEDNRIGLAAFISHSLGLRPWHMARVAEELAIYNRNHDRQHGENGHRKDAT